MVADGGRTGLSRQLGGRDIGVRGINGLAATLDGTLHDGERGQPRQGSDFASDAFVVKPVDIMADADAARLDATVIGVDCSVLEMWAGERIGEIGFHVLEELAAVVFEGEQPSAAARVDPDRGFALAMTGGWRDGAAG